MVILNVAEEAALKQPEFISIKEACSIKIASFSFSQNNKMYNYECDKNKKGLPRQSFFVLIVSFPFPEFLPVVADGHF